MTDRAFRELVDAAGGTQKFIDCMNAVAEDVGDIIPKMTTRSMYEWISGRGVPKHGHVWILAACLRAGLTRDQAIAAYPSLKAAHSLALMVTGKKAA